MTTLVILYLILKLFLILDKHWANGQGKNWNSCHPLNYVTTFYSMLKLSKIPRQTTKYHTTQNLFNTLNVCPILFYSVYTVMFSTCILRIIYILGQKMFMSFLYYLYKIYKYKDLTYQETNSNKTLVSIYLHVCNVWNRTMFVRKYICYNNSN
jgi:hypothetical protein